LGTGKNAAGKPQVVGPHRKRGKTILLAPKKKKKKAFDRPVGGKSVAGRDVIPRTGTGGDTDHMKDVV